MSLLFRMNVVNMVIISCSAKVTPHVFIVCWGNGADLLSLVQTEQKYNI